ncbi:MAG: hypothetical protein NZ521_10150, partial [Flammeovirgaceae bacterium]|nr:hypothetical protein [Flammeovirgaceae bacterium]
MEIIFKFLGIAGLAIIGIVVLLIVIFLVVFMFLALQLELKKPERKVLLEMTFRGTQFRYEELSKARVGHTEHQFLLSMNGKYIWSVGSEIEPLFRGTKHFVVPVYPEDLQNVVAIRRLAVHLSSPRLSDSSFAEIQRYVISTMGGRAMWLSPKDLTLDEFELIGDFLESYYAEEFIHQRKPLFYQDVLV